MIGAITPAMLVLLLRPYGYEVTQRCLTDWRYKGYLPPMAKVSRGFRKGILRYWNEKDILQRALAICRRLKGADRKREFGSIYKNWLSGADIPPSRAQESWIRDLERRAHVPKMVMQRSATEIGSAIQLEPRTVYDTLEEISQIMLRPNYTTGKTLDIFFIRNFIRRVGNAFGAPKNRPPIDDKVLVEALVWLNAVFSPAGIRNAVASATSAELRHARDRYRNWWRSVGAFRQRLNSSGEPEPSVLTTLADALGPLIVPLLLPTKSLEGRLARLEAL